MVEKEGGSHLFGSGTAFFLLKDNARKGRKKTWEGHRNQKGSWSWYRMFGGVVSFVDFLSRFEKMVSSSEELTAKSAKTYLSQLYEIDSI